MPEWPPTPGACSYSCFPKMASASSCWVLGLIMQPVSAFAQLSPCLLFSLCSSKVYQVTLHIAAKHEHVTPLRLSSGLLSPSDKAGQDFLPLSSLCSSLFFLSKSSFCYALLFISCISLLFACQSFSQHLRSDFFLPITCSLSKPTCKDVSHTPLGTEPFFQALIPWQTELSDTHQQQPSSGHLWQWQQQQAPPEHRQWLQCGQGCCPAGGGPAPTGGGGGKGGAHTRPPAEGT